MSKTNKAKRRQSEHAAKTRKLSEYPTYDAPIGDIQQMTLRNFEGINDDN